MKKIFSIIAAATIFVACNSKSDLDAQKDVIVTDTSAMYRSNASTDVGTNQTPNPAPALIAAPPTVAPITQTRTIIRERTVYVDRPRAQRQVVREADPVSPVVNTVPQSQPQSQSYPTASTGNGNNQSTGVGDGPYAGPGSGTASTLPEPVEKKKGWSNAAKDATIGGVGGAVGGAILSRNKGKGAIIGGIIGAAGGYILGRKKDKKDAETNYADN